MMLAPGKYLLAKGDFSGGLRPPEWAKPLTKSGKLVPSNTCDCLFLSVENREKMLRVEWGDLLVVSESGEISVERIGVET